MLSALFSAYVDSVSIHLSDLFTCTMVDTSLQWFEKAIRHFIDNLSANQLHLRALDPLASFLVAYSVVDLVLCSSSHFDLMNTYMQVEIIWQTCWGNQLDYDIMSMLLLYSLQSSIGGGYQGLGGLSPPKYIGPKFWLSSVFWQS